MHAFFSVDLADLLFKLRHALQPLRVFELMLDTLIPVKVHHLLVFLLDSKTDILDSRFTNRPGYFTGVFSLLYFVKLGFLDRFKVFELLLDDSGEVDIRAERSA